MDSKHTNLNRGDGTFFGPEDELPQEQIEKCKMMAVREMIKINGYDKDINLEADEDGFRVPGQDVALVSFIGMYDILKVKHDKFQINLRGACPDPESARKRINKIVHSGPDGNVYDIFTIGMYEWVAIPPNIEFMQDNQLHEEFLNGIIIRHRKDLLTKKYMFEVRKELINKSKKTAHIVKQDRQEPTEETVVIPNTDSDSESSNSGASSSVNEVRDSSGKEVTESSDSGGNEVTESSDSGGNEVTESSDSGGNEVTEPDVPNLSNKVPVVSKHPTLTDDFDSSEKLNQCASSSQNWVIFSTVGSLADGMAIKIQGFYDTEESARKVMERRRQIDDTFETYVAEAYRWLPVEHDVDDIEDQVFQNEHLNELYRTKLEEKKKAEDYNRMQKSKGNFPKPIAEIEEITPSEILEDLSK